MRLVCPSCGAAASAGAWENDAEARAAMAIIADLPRGVAAHALGWLALFRPRSRSLTWKRANRLLEELSVQVHAPEISWGQSVPRPNHPQAWAQAMERLLARPPKELPLAGHNYLRRMVYAIADEMDAARERKGEDRREDPRRLIEETTPEDYERNQARIRELTKGIGKDLEEERPQKRA